VGFLAAAAHATDGVIEINQAKAMAGGVTPGDSPGFPVTISVGGSYRLTSNLDVAAGGQGTPENLGGIVVQAGAAPKAVDIDLNGFVLLGPVTCTFGMNLSCSANESGSGIGIQDSSQGPLAVHDGTIQGFAGNGIQGAPFVNATKRIWNLDLRWNDVGASVYYGRAENVTSSQNRGIGVYAYYSLLSRILAHQNGGQGIAMAATVVDGCSCVGNAADGIYADYGSVVRNCHLTGNGGYGLSCYSLGKCGYSGNWIDSNASGTVIDGLETGGNVCGGDLTCP